MPEASVLLIFAHPYPDRSRANRLLLEAVESEARVAVRSLYDLYPTFDIDVRAEQEALRASKIVVWQHPMYWYSVPGLLKHWFDKVLTRGFAYGEGGNVLWGKRCFWVVTTGGDDRAFGSHGMHGRPFFEFSPVVEQTALFCGMHWEEPLVVHGAHRSPREDLEAAAVTYRERLDALIARVEHEEAQPRAGDETELRALGGLDHSPETSASSDSQRTASAIAVVDAATELDESAGENVS